ncbi:MAG: primosomal protein N' [Limnochordaceae bacterium]|nr:primosomal protein N' [Limnochordaceae bacterium]
MTEQESSGAASPAPPADRFAQVVIDHSGPLGYRPLDYRVPSDWPENLRGCRVRAPLGRRQAWGWIVGLSQHSAIPAQQLRPLSRLLDPEPLLTPVQLTLAQKLAEATFSAWAQTLRLVSPPGGWPGQRRGGAAVAESAEQVEAEAQTAASLELLAEPADSRGLGATPSPGDLPVETGLPLSVLLHLPSAELVLRPNPQMPPATSTQTLGRAPAREQAWRVLQQQPADQWTSVSFLMQQARVSRAVVLGLLRTGWVQAGRRLPRGTSYREGQVDDGPDTPPTLTADQARCLQPILAALQTPGTRSPEFLLHGITGSGKTEIYLQAIAAVLAMGRGAIVLVPEIALTPQTVRRFERRFGTEQVAVLHHRLPDRQRREEWLRIRRGKARVVIGARSAIFAPVDRLGLVVVDEEHEPSYKQEEAPRYHARDVARLRAQLEGAVLVLGSATPALETYFAARQGRSLLLLLPERIERRPLPQIRLVDLRREPGARLGQPFSRLLSEQMQAQVDAGHQVILFLNRRGLASFLLCRDCGQVVECPNCRVSLTYHGRPPLLCCHYCGREEPVPERCPACGSTGLRPWGIGTEKVEQAAAALLPRARVARLDLDTTRRQGAYEEILGAFARHEIDVLVGTQMVAKGLDFPDVTLVGVVAADTGLGFPDFRSAERTFQLLTQVSGRAGRSAAGGQVIIQTYNPEHYAIVRASHYDYLGFYREELALRRTLRYPPFTELARLLVRQPTEQAAREQAQEAVHLLEELGAVRAERLGPAGLSQGQVEIVGPAPAPLSRLQGKYRWHLLLKAWTRADILHLLQRAAARSPHIRQWVVDIAPLSLM